MDQLAEAVESEDNDHKHTGISIPTNTSRSRTDLDLELSVNGRQIKMIKNFKQIAQKMLTDLQRREEYLFLLSRKHITASSSAERIDDMLQFSVLSSDDERDVPKTPLLSRKRSHPDCNLPQLIDLDDYSADLLGVSSRQEHGSPSRVRDDKEEFLDAIKNDMKSEYDLPLDIFTSKENDDSLVKPCHFSAISASQDYEARDTCQDHFFDAYRVKGSDDCSLGLNDNVKAEENTLQGAVKRPRHF